MSGRISRIQHIYQNPIRYNTTLPTKLRRKSKKICFLFPGMGSHYIGMCKDLSTDFSYINTYLKQCDNQLGYNLSNAMFDSDIETFNTVPYGGMAMFVHSMCIWKILQTEYNIENLFTNNDTECTIIGHSMGECAAVTCAGLFTSDTDALYVTDQFSKANANMAAPDQAMCAVMSNPKNKDGNIINNINTVLKICNSYNIDIANINTPNQIVIS
eukprot:858427_1